MTNSSQTGARNPPTVSDGFGLIYRAAFAIEHPVRQGPHVRKSNEKRSTKKSTNRVFDARQPDKIGGEYMHRCFLRSFDKQFAGQPGFASRSRKGTPNGMLKQERAACLLEARSLAKEYMDDLRALYPSDDEIAMQATQALLEIGLDRAVNVTERVKAMSKVLEMYKSKPQPPVTVVTSNETKVVGSSVLDLLTDERDRLLSDE